MSLNSENGKIHAERGLSSMFYLCTILTVKPLSLTTANVLVI